MRDILKEICNNKLLEIEEAKEAVSLDEMKVLARGAATPKGFARAIELKRGAGKPALIAEIKKKSPSRGVIREDFNHLQIAKAYEDGGATCVSVLTDHKYFAGKNEYLAEVAANCSLPTIRKDFILDEYQVYEARALGADCVLLIMAALEKDEAEFLEKTAHDLGMDVLIEVHNELELEMALRMESRLIGVNNRNLKTLEINLDIGKKISGLIPDDYIKVCESGIYSAAEIEEMMDCGFSAFLVGESLMKQPDIEAAVKKLLGN